MTTRMDERFRKSLRLLKRAEYLKVQRWGFKVQSRAFIGLIKIRDTGNARLGIITTKKLGNAVVRNRTKRLIREAFRRGWMHLPDRTDVVIIAMISAARFDSSSVFDDLVVLGRRATKLVEQQL